MDKKEDIAIVCLTCGCGSTNLELLLNDGACYNCNTPLNERKK